MEAELSFDLDRKAFLRLVDRTPAGEEARAVLMAALMEGEGTLGHIATVVLEDALRALGVEVCGVLRLDRAVVVRSDAWAHVDVTVRVPDRFPLDFEAIVRAVCPAADGIQYRARHARDVDDAFEATKGFFSEERW